MPSWPTPWIGRPEVEISYHKDYSHVLGRDMELKVYGHAGRPCLVFPCQAGRPWDFESFGMVGVLAPWIDAGLLRLFCVDSLDDESLAGHGDPGARAWRLEQYHHYVADEVLPRMLTWGGASDATAMVMGTSAGGLHAAISIFRRPDLFDTMIWLSGLFDTRHYFGDWRDATLYENSPLDFVSGLPNDHPWLDRYRQRTLIAAAGQGAWEEEALTSMRAMDTLLARRGIPATFDYWGHDVPHDWPSWQRMIAHFMGKLLPLE